MPDGQGRTAAGPVEEVEVLAERGWRHYRWSRLGLALRVLAVAPLVYLAAATATVALLLTLEEVE